jgi:hypothetical protein
MPDSLSMPKLNRNGNSLQPALSNGVCRQMLRSQVIHFFGCQLTLLHSAAASKRPT